MTAEPFRCKCGDSFCSLRHLREHIGLQNPHWPRTSPNDKHAPANPATPIDAPGPAACRYDDHSGA